MAPLHQDYLKTIIKNTWNLSTCYGLQGGHLAHFGKPCFKRIQRNHFHSSSSFSFRIFINLQTRYLLLKFLFNLQEIYEGDIKHAYVVRDVEREHTVKYRAFMRNCKDLKEFGRKIWSNASDVLTVHFNFTAGTTVTKSF